MSLEKQFLADIKANPEDQLPVLVYCDWLIDENRLTEAEAITRTLDKEITKVEDMKGLMVASVEKEDGELIFTLFGGRKCKLCPNDDCGMGNNVGVWLEDINGNLDDLLCSPLTIAEECTNEGIMSNEDMERQGIELGDPESFTWTFYRFATMKGFVVLRWFGTSNGYCCEGVDFVVNPARGDRRLT